MKLGKGERSFALTKDIVFQSSSGSSDLGSSTPDQENLNQTKVIPQHTGVQGQDNRLSCCCDPLVMENIIQMSHMGSGLAITLREVWDPSPQA